MKNLLRKPLKIGGIENVNKGYEIFDFDGVVDFFNKNGEEFDDMNYPVETEILEEKETSTGYWIVVLNV